MSEERSSRQDGAAEPMSQPETTSKSAAPDWDAVASRVAESSRARIDAGRTTGLTDGLESALASIRNNAGATVHYSIKQTKHARDVLTRMFAVRRAARLYPFDHPAVREGVHELFESVSYFHEQGVEVQFAFYEGEILFGDALLAEESVLFEPLVDDMTGIGVDSLIFRRELDEDELSRAMEVLSAEPPDIARGGGVEAMMGVADAPHVYVGALLSLDRSKKSDTQSEPDSEARASFSGAVSLLREIDRLLRANTSIAPTKVKGVVRSLVDNVLTNRYAMLQLTGLKNYDEYTFYHSANVAILSLALGSLITSDYRFLSVLGTGALLHDIGKLAIDTRILNKPGPLTPEEWAAMREHPVAGAEMTELMPGVDKAALVSILEHHMRWDGTGYPTREPRRKQHLTSRIVAVADSYDAMTSQRSYSAPRVQDEAIALLAKSAGTSLDPVLVRLFIGLMGLYPPRSVVRISDGSIAIVVAPAEGEPTRPLVRVIAGADGNVVEPHDVVLAERPDLTVEGCIDPRMVNIDVDEFV